MKKYATLLSAIAVLVGCGPLVRVDMPPARVEITQPAPAPVGTDPAMECLSRGFRYDPMLKVCIRELDASQCNSVPDVQIITSARRGPATVIHRSETVAVDLTLLANWPAMLEHVVVSAPGFEQIRIERDGQHLASSARQGPALLRLDAKLETVMLTTFRIIGKVREDAVFGQTAVEISAVQIRLTETGKVTPCVWGGGILREFEITKKPEPAQPPKPTPPSQPTNPCDRGVAVPDAYVELLDTGVRRLPADALAALQRVAVTGCSGIEITEYNVRLRGIFTGPSITTAPAWQGFFDEAREGLPTLLSTQFLGLAGQRPLQQISYAMSLDYARGNPYVNDDTYVINVTSRFHLGRGERVEFLIRARHSGVPNGGEACFTADPPVLTGRSGGPSPHAARFERVGPPAEHEVCFVGR